MTIINMVGGGGSISGNVSEYTSETPYFLAYGIANPTNNTSAVDTSGRTETTGSYASNTKLINLDVTEPIAVNLYTSQNTSTVTDPSASNVGSTSYYRYISSSDLFGRNHTSTDWYNWSGNNPVISVGFNDYMTDFLPDGIFYITTEVLTYNRIKTTSTTEPDHGRKSVLETDYIGSGMGIYKWNPVFRVIKNGSDVVVDVKPTISAGTLKIMNTNNINNYYYYELYFVPKSISNVEP